MGTREPLLPSILNQLIACRRKPWLCEQRAGPAREETGFWAEVVIISDGESVCSYSVCVCVFFGCALIPSLPRTAAAVKLGPGGIPHRHRSPLPGEHTAGQQPQSLDQRAEVCGATSTWTRLNAHTPCPEVSHPNSKVPRILTPPLVCHTGTKAGRCSEKTIQPTVNDFLKWTCLLWNYTFLHFLCQVDSKLNILLVKIRNIILTSKNNQYIFPSYFNTLTQGSRA